MSGSTQASWQPVIGLEIHVQLATSSKLFSGAANSFGQSANSLASAVDAALPGTLPTINREALHMAIRFALATGGEIAPRLEFSRKNYFYPDLPKGYQISQHELPVTTGGVITLADGTQIGMERAHLEEDAGKSLHGSSPGLTGIDLNRAGVPLLEIVSLPVMHDVEQAVHYMKEVHTLVRALGISGANMERGEFRCDANISVRPGPDKPFGERTEIKNVNSFKFIGKALEYEIGRHTALYRQGQAPRRETRLYDPERNETRPMRGKELAEDYRYFPDPDLPQVAIPPELVAEISSAMPELPAAKRARYSQQYGLEPGLAAAMASDQATADYLDACVALVEDAKLCANWISNELFALLRKEQRELADCPVTAERMAGMLLLVKQNAISKGNARKLLALMWQQDGSAEEIMEQQGMRQSDDQGEVEALVASVLESCPEQVRQYLEGKEKVLGFLTGQVMKRGGGKLNPALANELLRRHLDKMKEDG